MPHAGQAARKTAQHKNTQHKNTQHKNTQHKNTKGRGMGSKTGAHPDCAR